MSLAQPSPWTPLSRATVAAVLSAALPGAGSYYLGRVRSAGWLLGLELIGSTLLALLWRLSLLPATAMVALLLVVTALVHVGGSALGVAEAWRGHGKRPFSRALGYMVLVALLLIGMQQVARDHLVATYVVTTSVMAPTLQEGDRVLARPPSMSTSLRRGEVVAIRDPELGQNFVRRLIGLPGDRVRIEGAEVLVNDRRLRVGPCGDGASPRCYVERSPDGLRYQTQDQVGAGAVHLEVTVPEGALFVLRDRRDLSVPRDPFPRAWVRGVVSDVWWSYAGQRAALDRLGRRVAPEEDS